MKVNIKTLKGTDFFEVEFDESTTVAEIKDRIAVEKLKEKDTIKLVHKGKQLNEDSKTLGEIGVKDKDFIILMFFVKKAEKEEKPSASLPATNLTTVPQVPVQQAPVASQSTASTAKSQVPASQQSTGNDLVLGPELEAKIKDIEAMGFERPKIILALQAAYNNPERAVDFLVSGSIPQVGEGEEGDEGDEGEEEYGENPDLENLASLAQNPQFQQIAASIRQNPQLLEPILAQLAQTNPDIARLFQENPEQLLALILGASGNEGNEPVPSNAIEVTLEEKADIEDIVSMGFDKNDALEAYIACDKNKELAINYLFDAKERGALLSEHINKEELEAATEQSLNPNQPNPNQPNPKPPHQEGEGDEEGDDDDDDFMFQ